MSLRPPTRLDRPGRGLPGGENRSVPARSSSYLLAAQLLLGSALLSLASCGDPPPASLPGAEPETGTEAPVVVPSGAGDQSPARPEVEAPPEVEAHPEEQRPSFERPDLMLAQPPGGAGDEAHPALQQGDPVQSFLEPLTSFNGEPVEFYMELHPGTDRPRVQGHRLVQEGESEVVLHGPEKRWFPNGQVLLQRVYDHGRATGEYIDWFENGFMKSRGRLEDDRPVGEWLRWGGKGGRLKEVSQWTRGLNDGDELQLWPRGELKAIIPWKMGKKHGLERVWDPEGQPLQLRGWSEGIDDGPQKVWNEDGVLVRSGGYSAGAKHGPWEEWFDDGTLRLRGAFEHGARVGEWVSWDERGTQLTLEHYAAGELEGEKKLWSPEGVLVFEGEFHAGKPIGEHREYFLGGGPKSISHYEDGLQSGEYREWHASGQQRSEGSMKAGKRQGRWTVWDDSGAELPAYGGLFEAGERIGD